MFCPKCGAKLPDSARFCNTCGNPIGSQSPAAEQTQHYTPPPRKPAKPFALPSFTERALLFYTFTMFIFSFFGWFRVSGMSELYSLFSGNLFNGSAILGIAKVFIIIDVFVFLGYAFFSYVNINKTGYGVSSADLKRICGIVYYGVYIFCLFFTLIGALTTGGGGILVISSVWYLALLGSVAGFVATLMPNLLNRLFRQ